MREDGENDQRLPETSMEGERQDAVSERNLHPMPCLRACARCRSPLVRSVTTHDCKVCLSHLLGQPVDLSLCVAEDDGLGDGEGVVEITEGVKLPILLLYGDEELLDPLEGQLVSLYEDPDRVGHELCRHLEDVVGEGGREDDDLGRGREVAVDVVDLLLEALVEQLVRLVEDEDLDVPRPQVAPLDHVDDPPWGPGNDVLAVVELAHVFSDGSASDAGMALHVHVVSEGEDDCRLSSRCARFTSA